MFVTLHPSLLTPTLPTHTNTLQPHYTPHPPRTSSLYGVMRFLVKNNATRGSSIEAVLLTHMITHMIIHVVTHMIIHMIIHVVTHMIIHMIIHVVIHNVGTSVEPLSFPGYP